MKKQLKTLGMVMVLGASLMFATGCSSTTTPDGSNTKVTEQNEQENVKELLISGEKMFDKIVEVLTTDIEDLDSIKEIDKLGEETNEVCSDIDTYLEKELWTEDTIEYKALYEMRECLAAACEGISKNVEYLETGKYSSYKEFTMSFKLAKQHHDNYMEQYREKLGISYDKEESESKEEENKTETKIESKKEIVEKGQCYDCGEYFPVDKMTFNGRSYHCGCANVYCEECKKEIPYNQEIVVSDQTYLCPSCYNKQQHCESCGKVTSNLSNYNGMKLCSDCQHDASMDETWICPDCGRENTGEVLCECEIEW